MVSSLPNQATISYKLVWFTSVTIFSTELKKQIYIWNKIEETTFADIDLFYYFSFIFK